MLTSLTGMIKRYRTFKYAGFDIRWFAFDEGQTVTFQTDAIGQPGFPGGMYALTTVKNLLRGIRGYSPRAGCQYVTPLALIVVTSTQIYLRAYWLMD